MWAVKKWDQHSVNIKDGGSGSSLKKMQHVISLLLCSHNFWGLSLHHPLKASYQVTRFVERVQKHFSDLVDSFVCTRGVCTLVVLLLLVEWNLEGRKNCLSNLRLSNKLLYCLPFLLSEVAISFSLVAIFFLSGGNFSFLTPLKQAPL